MKIPIIIVLLLLVVNCYAGQDLITGFDEVNDLPVLNEELRKLQNGVDSFADIKAKVSSNDTTAGYLNGKLVAGANISFTEGNNGANETLTIAATTSTTGFSNLVYCWTGQTDYTSTDNGIYIGNTTTPVDQTGQIMLLMSNNEPTEILLRSKFVKLSGIETFNVYARIWQDSAVAGKKAVCTVIAGGQSGSVEGTANQTTPEWKSFTVDVSGLTDGTVYDLTVGLGLDTAAGRTAYLSSVYIYGS